VRHRVAARVPARNHDYTRAVPPNVLCIVFDTARADALEPYGAPAGASPTVGQLARSGVAIRRAYATASWTVPSHASMFTGLLPRAAGLAAAVGEGGDPRQSMERLAGRVLPAVMRENGYRTAAVSTNVWISRGTGFATGFDEFATVNTGRQARLHLDALRPRLRWAAEGIRAGVDDGAAATAEVMQKWIDAVDDRPWFWFVNLVECHSPYLPPRPYNDLGPIARLRAAEEARRHLTIDAIWRACLTDFDVPAEALERMRHLYACSIRYMDHWLAEVLERLDAGGLLDETLVVLLSDHGENFGEGGLIGHAFSLDERLIHVPVIASGPGADSFEEGMVSLAELPRLLARAAGLRDHPWDDESLPEGAAVAQFDPPVPPRHPRAPEAREKLGLDDAAFRRLTTPFAAATDGRLKLVREGAAERAYDLRSDPLEIDPLPPARLDGDAALVTLREALRHPTAMAAAPPGGPLPSPDEAERPGDPDEVAEIEDRMKLLGYM
jgi:arylsulfatase A-like enzyme